jgi:acyl-CoA synthetase (AMP-forming)/AMP-acid ligase II
LAESTEVVSSRFEAFLDGLRTRGDRECLACDGQSHSYADLLRKFTSARDQLAALGAERGIVVGLRADYSLESVAALLALLAARTTVAMLPRDRDTDRLLEDCQATALLDIDQQGQWNWTSLPASDVRHPLLAALQVAGDAGIVLFTSGSTGRPKAALQSMQRFLRKFDRPGKSLRTLAFLLFDHVAGLDTLFYTLANGGAVVVTRDRSPSAISRLIDDARVEVLSASPTFLRLLCLAGDDGERSLASLKIITYGSEPMDPRTLALLNERFPNCRISQKYGTTETGSPRSTSRDNNSLWLKLAQDGVETRVVNGELQLRSESTILGYLNAPSPVDAEGWYSTGDLVEVDGDWIRFRGRSSEQINVGGEKVAPSEVEQVLLELDFIRQAVVSGESNPIMGQVVAARIVLANGVDERDAVRSIRNHCRSRLAPHMIPVKVHFESGSLSTSRHKIQRIPHG